MRHTVEARADRLQRRYAARWVWGLPTSPATSRPIELWRLDVALHDLQREILRGFLPMFRCLRERAG